MRRRRRAGEKRRKSRRPILRKLCATLLRPFRGQHSEKMKGSARGNWDPQEVQQPFRPNPNGVGDRATTLRRLLIGAVQKARWEDVAFYFDSHSFCRGILFSFVCCYSLYFTGTESGQSFHSFWQRQTPTSNLRKWKKR